MRIGAAVTTRRASAALSCPIDMGGNTSGDLSSSFIAGGGCRATESMRATGREGERLLPATGIEVSAQVARRPCGSKSNSIPIPATRDTPRTRFFSTFERRSLENSWPKSNCDTATFSISKTVCLLPLQTCAYSPLCLSTVGTECLSAGLNNLILRPVTVWVFIFLFHLDSGI